MTLDYTRVRCTPTIIAVVETASTSGRATPKERNRTMTYTSMTKRQKEQICAEAENRKARKDETSCSSLARWAKENFNLPTEPGRSTLSRILKRHRNLPRHSSVIQSSNLTRARNGQGHAVESALFAWVCDQYKRRAVVNGRLIQGKAIRLQEIANDQRDDDHQTRLTFSDGWLNRFKKRWGLLVVRSNTDRADDCISPAESTQVAINEKLSKYDRNDIFNASESALTFRKTPDKIFNSMCTNPAPHALEDRITILFCCNADGMEKAELMVIGTTCNPRSFGKQTGHDLGFNYRANSGAYMTSALFFEWLVRFDAHIARTPGRRVALLIDSCSAHGTTDTVPALTNVDIFFIPPNTKTTVQPCNAGIISTLKVRYRTVQLDRAMDLVDEDQTDIYRIEILTAMRAVKRIWNELPASVIVNSWNRSKLIREDVALTDVTALTNVETADRAYLQERIHGLVAEQNRLPIDDFIHSKSEDDCIQNVTDESLISHVVDDPSFGIAAQGDQAADSSEAPLPPLSEQLKALALVKRIAVAHHVEDALISGLRRLQTALRVKKEDEDADEEDSPILDSPSVNVASTIRPNLMPHANPPLVGMSVNVTGVGVTGIPRSVGVPVHSHVAHMPVAAHVPVVTQDVTMGTHKPSISLRPNTNNSAPTPVIIPVAPPPAPDPSPRIVPPVSSHAVVAASTLVTLPIPTNAMSDISPRAVLLTSAHAAPVASSRIAPPVSTYAGASTRVAPPVPTHAVADVSTHVAPPVSTHAVANASNRATSPVPTHLVADSSSSAVRTVSAQIEPNAGSHVGT